MVLYHRCYRYWFKSVKKYHTKTNENIVNFIEDKTKGLGFGADKNADSKYHYEITYNKPGGLVMPIIVQFSYKDGTSERKVYPAQIWRYNDKEVTKVFSTNKQLSKITIDPNEETADVDTSNNSWPKESKNKFEKFKSKIKG